MLTDSAGRFGRRPLPRCYDPLRAQQLTVYHLFDVNAYALDDWLAIIRHQQENTPCA